MQSHFAHTYRLPSELHTSCLKVRNPARQPLYPGATSINGINSNHLIVYQTPRSTEANHRTFTPIMPAFLQASYDHHPPSRAFCRFFLSRSDFASESSPDFATPLCRVLSRGALPAALHCRSLHALVSKPLCLTADACRLPPAACRLPPAACWPLICDREGKPAQLPTRGFLSGFLSP